MNILVFVLIVMTDVDGELVKSEYGAWKSLPECVYFSRTLALQNRLPEQQHFPEKLKTVLFKMPLKAWCEPKYIDPETTEVY